MRKSKETTALELVKWGMYFSRHSLEIYTSMAECACRNSKIRLERFDLLFSEADIFTVEEHCSRYKWLVGGVVFLEVIPRTPSGKVKRRELPNAMLERTESKI